MASVERKSGTDGYGRIIGVGIGLSVLVVDERLVVANRMGSHCYDECLYGKSCDISHCIWLLLDTQYVFGEWRILQL